MGKFTAQGGQFLLNDRPVFIQAGEFHYYRTPPEYWSHRLGLLKEAGFNAVATYIPWLWHELGEGVSDVDGHSHPMRNIKGFLDLAAGMDFWIIPRPGPYIMAETTNEGIPHWVFDKYPRAAFISQEDKAQNIASYLHPDFLACVRNWYRVIFDVLTPRQTTRGGRIIMVQLDNEMGMMPWVRNIMDVNPDTMARFAGYLKDVYGEGLADLYPPGDLESFLGQGILHPEGPRAERIVEDYRRFYRVYMKEYASFLVSEATACGLEVPPVVNIHGFANGGKTFPIGLSQLIDAMRLDGMLSATDVYPGIIGEGTFHQLLLVNEMTKALQNKEQALFSIEFQAGGYLDFSNTQSSLFDLHSRLCISSGMRAINHYLFCSGENDPLLSNTRRHDWGHPVRQDGSLRRHYYRYPKLSGVLASYGDALVQSKPETVTTIGFQLDDFMTEVNNACSQETTRGITHQRDAILFDTLARSLAITHRAFNTLDLERGELDVAHTPHCWAMMEKRCHPAVHRKLVDYVHQGGKLILMGRMCTQDFHRYDCTILKDAIGIAEIQADQPFAATHIDVFDHRHVPASFLETYTGDFDEVFARSETGGIAGFVKKMGKGIFIMLGAAMLESTLVEIDIVDQMAMKVDCPAPFELSEWADVRLSRGEMGSFLFINNYQDDPVEPVIRYLQKPLFGGNPIHLPARRGMILPLEWRFNRDILIHYVTSEILKITGTGSTIRMQTDQAEFSAEFSLSGYHCDEATLIGESARIRRFSLHGRGGEIGLVKDA